MGRNALTRLKVDEDDWHTDKKEKESENKERGFLHEFKEMKKKNISKAEGCPPATLRTNKGGLIGTDSVGGCPRSKLTVATSEEERDEEGVSHITACNHPRATLLVTTPDGEREKEEVVHGTDKIADEKDTGRCLKLTRNCEAGLDKRLEDEREVKGEKQTDIKSTECAPREEENNHRGEKKEVDEDDTNREHTEERTRSSEGFALERMVLGDGKEGILSEREKRQKKSIKEWSTLLSRPTRERPVSKRKKKEKYVKNKKEKVEECPDELKKEQRREGIDRWLVAKDSKVIKTSTVIREDSRILKNIDAMLVTASEAPGESNTSLHCYRPSKEKMSDLEPGRDASPTETKSEEDLSSSDDQSNQPSTSTGIVRGGRTRGRCGNIRKDSSEDEFTRKPCSNPGKKKISLRATSTPSKRIQ